MLGDLLYQLGLTVGGLGARVRGGGGAGGAAVYDPDTGDVYDIEDDWDEDGEAGETMENALVGAAATWLLTRVLRPRPVSWPRVILAGMAASVMADVVGRAFEEEPSDGRLPYAADPEELMARLGAGVAVAAGYASLLYPRIPGSPLFRGLVFGALEIAAAPRGGLVHMAAGTPGLRFPLQALATPVDEDAGPLSHMAFGLALGLFYRDGGGDDDEDDDD